MKKRRILFFVWNLEIGGAEWVITNLSNEFMKMGLEVTLISKKGGNLLKQLNASIVVYDMKNNLLKTIIILFKSLIPNKFDCVFSTQPLASTTLSFIHLFCFSNCELIIREPSHFRYYIKQHKGFEGHVLKLLAGAAYKRADLIIANSMDTLEALFQYKIIKQSQKTSIISNPLAIEDIIEKSKLAVPLAIDKKSRLIISIGRLVPMKNMNILIESFSIVREKFTDSKLIILGEGPEKIRLEKLAKELGIEKHVHFLGKVSNPYPYLAKAEVFVLASENEGFGMAVAEALALGIPVVATNNSGPRDILLNGKIGNLVPIGSATLLADAIVQNLCQRPDKSLLQNRAKDFDKGVISQIYINTIFD
jgi:glycosyltransferase involved in cell wall biosynthesis